MSWVTCTGRSGAFALQLRSIAKHKDLLVLAPQGLASLQCQAEKIVVAECFRSHLKRC